MAYNSGNSLAGPHGDDGQGHLRLSAQGAHLSHVAEASRDGLDYLSSVIGGSPRVARSAFTARNMEFFMSSAIFWISGRTAFFSRGTHSSVPTETGLTPYTRRIRSKHVVIVTRDTDYGVTHQGSSYLNDWLRQEFSERVSQKRKVILTDKLSQGLKLVHAAVTQDMVQEEDRLLESKAVVGTGHAVLEFN